MKGVDSLRPCFHGSCTTSVSDRAWRSTVFVAMALTRRSRPATLWLQMLLVGGLACVVIVLVQVYRLHRSNYSVIERALRDYSTFAAWSYGQHLTSKMRESVDELLGAVNHGDGL